MADKRRALIREKLRELLAGKVARVKGNVFTNVASATMSEQLPLIAIYSRSEDLEIFNQAPREYKRVLHLMIEILASGDESAIPEQTQEAVEDTLDEIVLAVEMAVNPDETLGEIADPAKPAKKIRLVDEFVLQNIEFTFRGEGDKPMGAAVMHYLATYYQNAPFSMDEQDGAGTFQGADVTWQVGDPVVGHPEGGVGIQDTVTIPS